MEQKSIFSPEQLPSRFRWQKLFDNLPALQEQPCAKRGRPRTSRNALLKGLIYKALRRLATLSDLVFELENNPSMTNAIGLDIYKRSPSVERFSAFARATPNEDFQVVKNQLVQSLLSEAVMKGRILALDSCPIVIKLKENNAKASLRYNRFDKEQKPKGDPEAGLGIIGNYINPIEKNISFFWGYRNHVVSDADTELPIVEQTLPANKSEVPVAVPLLKRAKKNFSLGVTAVTGDAAYDTEDILKFIVKELKALAVIPRNPRNTQSKEGFYIKKGQVYCPANLPMSHKGKMTVKGITYIQHRCPLHWDKQLRRQYLICPAGHPKFIEQKGCNYLIRLTPSIREQIDYHSPGFKKIYNKRTSIERIFSRLLSVAMQEPTVKGLKALRNHCTIAHIAVLLIALTASRSGYKDKFRFIKSFVPNFLG